MRQYAWYSDELNVIVLQSIMEGCPILFEWGNQDMLKMVILHGTDIELMSITKWIPLGEI
jgi:hypothetical protein